MAELTGVREAVRDRYARAEFEDALRAAGFEQIEIVETHRVHESAGSAIVRARMPD